MAEDATLGTNQLIRGTDGRVVAREQFGAKCLAQRHISMSTGGSGNQTADLLMSGRLCLLSEGVSTGLETRRGPLHLLFLFMDCLIRYPVVVLEETVSPGSEIQSLDNNL